MEGIITYVPGANLCRPHTSRRLIKEGDLAEEAWYLKYFISRGPWPSSSNYKTIQTCPKISIKRKSILSFLSELSSPSV